MRVGGECFGIPKNGPGCVIQVSSPSGYGSLATYTRYFTLIEQLKGSAIKIVSDPAYGTRFLIQESGVYAISYSGDQNSSSTAQPGVVLNSNGTSPPPATSQLTYNTASAGAATACCVVTWLNAGDVIYPQTINGVNCNKTGADIKFTVSKVS